MAPSSSSAAVQAPERGALLAGATHEAHPYHVLGELLQALLPAAALQDAQAGLLFSTCATC